MVKIGGEEALAEFERAQERWFATDPRAAFLANMADAEAVEREEHTAVNAAAEFAADGTREAAPILTEWSAYLAVVDVNDGRSPGERLAAVFSS